ncbi:primosomal protein N' [uncultured Dubosiella sp.]|uniref:replication restart helicase PriA n=1 Tax=uncultured Dubosiella sp. TaxID=1937011 RepID=UPI00259810A4|nr:primosomal protein N' [uncultured Dubosiella sp.]
MPFYNVWIEHVALDLNQTFTYRHDAALERGMRVKVPFNHRELVAIVMEACEQPDDPSRIKDVIEVLDEQPLLNEELFGLAAYMADTYVSSMMSCFKTMLPPALRPATRRASVVYEDWFVAGDSTQPLTKKGQETWERLKDALPMKASAFRKLAKSHARSFLERGYLRVEKRRKESALDLPEKEDQTFALTDEQRDAIAQISASSHDVFLLHGVTGSGKTEVFLRLAEQALSENRQVLFLVPEIGLTPMMIARVRSRFRQNIAIYHSQMSASEKYDQYEKVRTGEVQIVVGTRSACFMPFSNLGLILMDEEHDTSYKQDMMPKYHTRDLVLWRGAYHHCKVVLASATPSLESYARAYRGVFELVELKQRIARTMPAIRMIDLRQEPVVQGFSQSLLDAIARRLEKKEQVILLLNRRGYLPVVKCQACNEVITCPDCGIALSYHRSNDSLMCHCCGTVYAFDHTCPHCGSKHFFDHGMGTEKLEQRIQSLFPQARIVRMDADSTRKKNAHARLLEQFENEGDILIGTQMVAKGLDFPNVTLVGILQADAGLVRSDYRASEIAYEMLEQASGRAGRAEKEGEVLIQTFDQDHYVMKSVQNHDYKSFFVREMQYRHLGSYPPYVYMATIVFSHDDLEKAERVARQAKERLDGVRVLGPIEISMRMKKKRVRLLVKDKSQPHLETVMWDLVHHFDRSNVKMEINMHPLMLEE